MSAICIEVKWNTLQYCTAHEYNLLIYWCRSLRPWVWNITRYCRCSSHQFQLLCSHNNEWPGMLKLETEQNTIDYGKQLIYRLLIGFIYTRNMKPYWWVTIYTLGQLRHTMTDDVTRLLCCQLCMDAPTQWLSELYDGCIGILGILNLW